MYPGAKFSTRPASPQFVNFSPPSDYPSTAAAAAAAAATSHHHSMSMRHPKSMASSATAATSTSKGLLHRGSSSRHTGMHMVNSTATMGGVGGRSDLMFPDDIDSIEFCMPPPPAPADDDGDICFSTGNGVGVSPTSVDLMMMRGTSNGLCSSDEAFTERKRRGHSRRSNHKMDVEQQVKWTRKNIAATMERFEPTNTSTGSLDYGFAAGVVSPSTTPHHQSHQSHVSQLLPPPPALQQQQQQQQQQQLTPVNHVYSYAYYEPGAAKCHTNIPHRETLSPILPAPVASSSKSPPRNSIRALLAKSFRSKTLNGQLTAEERHTYTTRYGTTENLYEEVNEQKIRKVLSDNRIATSGSGAVKEELRRVQHNHFRVLDELNLSLEALIMPPTPPDISPTNLVDDQELIDQPSTSAVAAAAAAVTASTSASAASASSIRSQQKQRKQLIQQQQQQQQSTLSHGSLENLSNTLNSIELKDHSSCINPEFDEGDLDSGFSGSGSSSGASYNESLRYYKTGTQCNVMQTTTLPHNLRSCRSSTASGTSTSKSSMNSSEDQGIGVMMTSTVAANSSPFNYGRRCSDVQRSSARSSSATSYMATATGTKPKKNFWTIKP